MRLNFRMYFDDLKSFHPSVSGETFCKLTPIQICVHSKSMSFLDVCDLADTDYCLMDVMVLGILGPGQLGPGQLGPGQSDPGHPLTWIQRKSHRFGQGAHVYRGKSERDPAELVLTFKTWALYSVRCPCPKSGLLPILGRTLHSTFLPLSPPKQEFWPLRIKTSVGYY